MKLSISNIAWDHSKLGYYLPMIRSLGCDGVELAPSCIWPEPIYASIEERKFIREIINKNNLQLTGFHALLYTRPDLQLFKDRKNLANTIRYLQSLSDLCAELGGRVLVLGSPNNRSTRGRDYGQCVEWATEAFYNIARYSARREIMFCLEPLSPNETDFVDSSIAGLDLVKEVNHPNFRLHLDTKSIIYSNEDIDSVVTQCYSHLEHIHVADPNLMPPGSSGYDHNKIGTVLRDRGYDNFVSIEMKKENIANDSVLENSIKYVKQCYL